MPYQKFQATAKKLIGRFQQGVIEYRIAEKTGGAPWEPTRGERVYPVDGVVSGVQKQLVDGNQVISSDLQATLPAFGADPTTEGRLFVDSREYRIIKVSRVPAAGVVVVWKLVIR